MKPSAALTRWAKRSLPVLFIVLIIASTGCYHYRILNTNDDPGTEYRDTVVRSYLWGLVNKPQDFHVPNCDADSCTAINEVVFSKNFGQALLTVITLGIVSPVKVQWRCHKPCQRVIEGL
jgi:hypothetical protein